LRKFTDIKKVKDIKKGTGNIKYWDLNRLTDFGFRLYSELSSSLNEGMKAVKRGEDR
jgi:hypothetical protein